MVFGAAVAEAVGRGDVRLVVDLGGVDYVSSAGLRALATAEDQCIRARGALSVCRLTEPVRIALDLGGLLSQLSIEPTCEDGNPPGRDAAGIQRTSRGFPAGVVRTFRSATVRQA